MRLAILAAREDTFYVLIDGPHFEPPLPSSFFRNAELRSLCASLPNKRCDSE
ncbi:MAG: hypothetical protein ABSF45_30450 [Terriglobia bacterium]